uniref:26S proteasome non-ATPase regulatory subunit 4 n=1 Tax=Lygus hesperus TaxID=30085 RepID=A0A146KSA0_LYGHE
MVLESTMICVDNSDFMRNGDFLPTRLQAQQDAVNLVCHSKTRSNPENNVGLLTLANVEVLATLTTDVGRIQSKLHQLDFSQVNPNGDINLLTGIRIAHLALKHRQGKNHKMRIVAFVGSPIGVDDKELVKLAKRLKKEKVNVDIVSFGEEAENNDLLTLFINTLNGKEGGSSHLVSVPPGPHLSDALISSPVIQGEDGAGAAGLGGAGFEFGVDPNEDPELALALRVSMEEQRQRQDALNSATSGATAAGEAAGGQPKPEAAPGGQDTGEMAMLERALAMSLDGQPTESAPQHDFSNMTEEEQIAFAIQMSMQESENAASTSADQVKPKQEPPEEKMETEDTDDPAYVRSVLENLPGVDPGADETPKSRRDNKK